MLILGIFLKHGRRFPVLPFWRMVVLYLLFLFEAGRLSEVGFARFFFVFACEP